MDKYLSVLTNFGCHYTCPYCIVKNTGIDIPKTTIGGLDNLANAIKEHGANWVSVSGGGDPLYDYYDHQNWWDRFFNICEKASVNTELHTSYFTDAFNCGGPLGSFNRVVYHCRNVSDLFRIKRTGCEIIRAVYVVDASFDRQKIDAIVTIVKHHPAIDELSFRQMVDENYQTTHYCEEYLKAGHRKDWWYIEQNDYNVYYAENEVKFRYEDFRRI